jgi:hypothetical protein
MSAIGEESLLPIAYDATGSVTQKLGRMMLQLEQIKNNGGGGGGGSTVISSGTISVQGISLDGALVSGSPVLLGVQGRNLLARTLHSYLAASGTVGANMLAVGSLVQDETMTLWPLRQASAVSGTTGIGLQAVGPMICGADGRFWSLRSPIAVSGTAGIGIQSVGPMLWDGNQFWPKPGNRLGAYVHGFVASGQVFTGNPVIFGAVDSAGNASTLRVDNSAAGNLKTVQRGSAITASDGQSNISNVFLSDQGNSPFYWTYGWTFNGTTWDRQRSAIATSGGIGTGLLGAGNLVHDGSIWWPLRGNNLAPYVQGPVASGQLFTGNPVVTAAQDVAGNATSLRVENSANPNLRATLYVGSSQIVLGTGSDGQSNANQALVVSNRGYLLNTAGTWDRMRDTASVSGTTGLGLQAAGSMLYDGNVWLPQRTASSVAATPGVGLPGAALLGFDGTNFQLTRTALAGNGQSVAEHGIRTVTRLQVSNAGASWDAVVGALAASGGIGAGLFGIGNMVQGTDGIWWTAKGNNTAPYVQGPLAAGAAVAGANPLLIAGQDLSANTRLCRVNNNNLDANGAGQDSLLTIAQGWAFNPAGTWDRIRTANAASGGIGTGLLGVGQMVQGTDGIWWPTRQWVGTHANAWSSGAITSGAISAAVDCQGQSNISIFGTTNAINTFTVQMSQDNLAWYQTSFQIANVTGNFGAGFTIGARWVRLVATGTSTVTATIAAKV